MTKPDYAEQLEDLTCETLLEAFLAAAWLAGLKDREFYITWDVTYRPYYAKAAQQHKKRIKKRLPGMTEATFHSEPAFRGKDGRSHPMYQGTIRKHDMLVLAAHMYDTKECFPLGVFRGGMTDENLAAMGRQLDRLPIRPAFVLADRESATQRATAVVRAWADRHKIAMLIPIPRNSQVRLSAERAWKGGLAQPVEGSDQPTFFHVENATWTSDRTATPHALIHFYLPDDPRTADSDDEDGVYMVSGKHVVSFYSNVVPTAASAWTLFLQFRHRWAQENLHKRHHALVGRSDSSRMLPRDRQFHHGMIALAAYALWRVHRRICLGLKGAKAAKSRLLTHTRFFQDAAHEFRDRILRRGRAT